MDDELKRNIFLEHCWLPAKLDGGKIDLKGMEFPLVGIKGLGTQHKRGKKKSTWVVGEILSPNVMGNDNCACRSHLEGIAMEDGRVRLLEAVYGFLAYSGSCFEYDLVMEEFSPKDLGKNPIRLSGKVISRLRWDGFEPKESGKIYLSVSPYWMRGELDKSLVPSLSYYNRHSTCGTSIPEFWKTFLGEIEEQGYDHPYLAVSQKLAWERNKNESRLRCDDEQASQISAGESDSADPRSLPF